MAGVCVEFGCQKHIDCRLALGHGEGTKRRANRDLLLNFTLLHVTV